MYDAVLVFPWVFPLQILRYLDNYFKWITCLFSQLKLWYLCLQACQKNIHQFSGFHFFTKKPLHQASAASPEGSGPTPGSGATVTRHMYRDLANYCWWKKSGWPVKGFPGIFLIFLRGKFVFHAENFMDPQMSPLKSVLFFFRGENYVNCQDLT